MSNVNLFHFAKKELSQDAVICSIIAGEDERAESFVKTMIYSHPVLSEDTILLSDSFRIIHRSLKQQDGNIDIFFEIVDLEKRYAVIIEDKTDSSMHDQQMSKYIENKMDTGRYSGCFFILFKTGKIPFWEQDDYKDEITLMRRKRLGNSQSIKGGANGKAAEVSYDMSRKKERLHFSLFDRYQFINYLHEHKWDDMPWMSDYLSYITDNALFQSDTVFPWMERFTGTKEQFANKLSGGIWNNISIYSPKGNGKRKFDCAFEGICGSAALERIVSSDIFAAYYLLPVVTFSSRNSAHIKLNYHAFQKADDPQGYCSFSKYETAIKEQYKEKRKELLSELQKKLEPTGWKVSIKPKDNSLVVCSINVKDIDYSFIFDNTAEQNSAVSELQKRIQELLNAVMQIRETVFRKQLDGKSSEK